jgi:hypothetical protein
VNAPPRKLVTEYRPYATSRKDLNRLQSSEHPVSRELLAHLGIRR